MNASTTVARTAIRPIRQQLHTVHTTLSKARRTRRTGKTDSEHSTAVVACVASLASMALVASTTTFPYNDDNDDTGFDYCEGDNAGSHPLHRLHPLRPLHEMFPPTVERHKLQSLQSMQLRFILQSLQSVQSLRSIRSIQYSVQCETHVHAASASSTPPLAPPWMASPDSSSRGSSSSPPFGRLSQNSKEGENVANVANVVANAANANGSKRWKHPNQHRHGGHPHHHGGRASEMNKKYNVDWSNVVGEGAYGKVYPARIRATGEKVALKKISKRYTNSASFRSETDALLRIYDNGGHPNISGLRDMYEDSSHYYLILDLVTGGEMFDHLIQYGSYSEADAARLAMEILSALAFLHNIGVVHADLKPENILLCERRKGAETIKIIDFGCAFVDPDRGNYSQSDSSLDSNSSSSSSSSWKSINSLFRKNQLSQSNAMLSKLSVGTKAYWAPECFQKNATITESMDMWALGVILYIMLVGAHPFDIKGIASDEEIQDQITKNPSPPMGIMTAHLSASARDFIKSLMAADPNDRLTAITALNHPWIRGDTPTSSKIMGSDEKLCMYQDLRMKLATGIFAALVDKGNVRHKISEKKYKYDGSDPFFSPEEVSSRTHILKRAFEVFDEEGKGYVNEADVGRVMNRVTGAVLSPEDRKDMIAAAKEASTTATRHAPSSSSNMGLSLSDFSRLFSRLSHQHFPRGHVIFHAGDRGDAMYFINSGKVEILTKKGHLVSILRHGDFFGEGSLLEERNPRFTTAKCATPVDVIRVSREEFEKYVASSTGTKLSLKEKWKGRTLAQAKQLIRIQTNLTKRELRKGEVVYNEGDIGTSMFLVDEGNGGKLEVRHGAKLGKPGAVVVTHTYEGGDSFGESSLLFQRPRSSTVVCASDSGCRLHEMRGSDFYALLESDPSTTRALLDMCRKRMFKKAVKSYLLSQNHGLSNEELVKAFHDADKDESGSLSLGEVRNLMLRMDPNYPESEVVELLKFLDLDEDGQVTLKEFQRVFESFD